ncbi:MAG: hypothetical protein EBY32_13575 [Proteobacteria bacterium]|nr:hypothetical protein [Pseudomonadota bacterium]
MTNKEELKKIIYALTLRDRPDEMRDKWLKKGFRKINRNPLALITYWENRLSNGDREDIDLFESVLADYKAYLEGPRSTEKGVKNEPAVWGPILWKELHDRTGEYAMDVEAENVWIESFQSRIPCGQCKTHFRSLITEMPPDLASREGYVQWAVDVHNRVNESLGKPVFEPAAQG